MSAEIGQISLILALMIALAQGVLPLLGAHRLDGRLMAFGDRAALAQAVFLIAAFVMLCVVFLASDFSVNLVAKHSHTAKPWLYKLSGTWGNHEGSMLLWVLILGLFGGAISLFGSSLPSPLRARALGIQGLVGAGFLAFLIFTSNPFERLSPIPEDGSGLNPLLQDPGLAFHPPFLYLGYVGFSVAFSFAIAALIEGRVDALWARFVRPWVLAAWSFLTLGIALGSVWAYYELGWGGWWFWDPVENVSLMPWLAGTALLHSTLVVEKRNTFMNWTLLLAITTFSLSLIGTFIVRSGVLTSVHAFAVDPERGVFILGLLGIATGGALILYAVRAGKIASTTSFDALSREGGLVMNNLLLCIATATVFIGTFYPLLIDALTSEKLTVGPPYFNLTFAPIMAGLIVFMAVGPLLKWRTDKPARLVRPLLYILGAIVIAVIATLVLGKAIWGIGGMALAAALAAGACLSMGDKLFLGKRPLGDSLKLAGKLPASSWGFFLGHIGLAVTVVGITGMSVWAKEGQARIDIGQSAEIAGYTLTLADLEQAQRANFAVQTAVLDIGKNGRNFTQLRAERRYYPVEEQMTTEAALSVGVFRTLYGALGDGNDDGWLIRYYVHPFVSWIWAGAVIMALGGFISMTDRRFRLPGKPRSQKGAKG
ncbi:heme lyase CcmF/NrfE family subunit [Ponticaulis profundi]|uniref:Heme lyase CcmF/NrfE family subunit n=1 Tax=Ponticaulis profundi TaxID=2665222 RepID=A0ABW1S645_9PROT